ncbi:MAG: hypothetical protein KDA81_01085 [Planctomycetaceae bacterium]|nr:hypothetical protein [Planctomycetaceae bacterium]
MHLLTDNPWPLVIAFAAAAVVAALTGSPRGQKMAGVFLLMAAGVFLLERYLVSPEERVEATVQQMLDNFKQRNLDGIQSQISPHSPALIEIARQGLDLVDLSPAFHIKSAEVTLNDTKTTATAMVRANGEVTLRKHGGATHRVPNYWRTEWVLEDGVWKLSSATRLNPVNGTEMGYFAGN